MSVIALLVAEVCIILGTILCCRRIYWGALLFVPVLFCTIWVGILTLYGEQYVQILKEHSHEISLPRD